MVKVFADVTPYWETVLNYQCSHELRVERTRESLLLIVRRWQWLEDIVAGVKDRRKGHEPVS